MPIGLIILTIAMAAGLSVTLSSSGGGGWSNAVSIDRVADQLSSQARLIATKTIECSVVTAGNPGADWPATPATTLVVDALCPGDPAGSQNLWTGARPSSPPPTPTAFQAWHYANSATNIATCGPATNIGGICIWTIPTTGGADPRFKAGAAKAAARFGTTEADADATTSRFTYWIKRL